MRDDTRRMLRCIAALLLACGCMFSAVAAPPAVTASFQHDSALLVMFDRSMQTWANERRSDVVQLQPALPMTCTWQSDFMLSCDPVGDRRPALATRYRVQLASGLKTQAGESVPGRALFAETARPRLGATIERWKDGRPEIVVTSDDKVGERAAAAVLRLTLDGKPVALPPLRRLPARGKWEQGHRFAIPPPAIDGQDRRLVLAVVPGLQSSAGPLRGTQQINLIVAEVNERFALSWLACAGRERPVRAFPQAGEVAATCLPDEAVQLVFSKSLDAASRARVERSLPTGVRVRSWKSNAYRSRNLDDAQIERAPRSWVDLEVDDAHVERTIVLGADLRAEEGGAALEPVRLTLRTDDFRPRIRAKHARSLIADGKRPPVLAEALNAGANVFSVRGLGKRADEVVLRIAERRDNTPRPVASPLTAQLLAEGGWAQWAPARKQSDRRWASRFEEGLQFAAPGFDLHAVAGRREVLAWANAWDDNAAIAGAEIELLWWDELQAQPRVLARAATDKDGLAMLRLPEDFVGPHPEDDETVHASWLIRATQSGRAHGRAVLPIGAADEYGLDLGRPNQRMTWGVSDRPLYRAGDRVHYRLWQRDRSGTRLLPIRESSALELRLENQQDDKTILEWQVTPDAEGSVDGELMLPVHLTDATYCIGVGERYDLRGACFFVGTYRAQDLWAEAKTDDRILRDGDRFALDVNAGYYSGGAAAGIDIARIQSDLDPLPLAEAYPQYADYTFVDVDGDDVTFAGLEGTDDIKQRLDTKGAARIDLTVAFEATAAEKAHLPAFAHLVLEAEVKPEDREGTVSNSAQARYTRFERFVGLRLEPTWLDAHTPVRARGVVIDAEGKLVPDAQIDVQIDYLPDFDDGKTKPQRVGSCRLTVDAEAPCDFPRAKSGQYRLTAQSGAAAPAEVMQYIWVGNHPAQGAVAETTLTLLDAPPRDGRPIRVLLKQPHARAKALFVFRAGDRLLDYRVEDVAGTMQSYVLPVDPSWRGELSLDVLVRDAKPAVVRDGYRDATDAGHASLTLRQPIAVDAAKPVSVAFDAATATPGATVHVLLRNDSAQPREVVLSVMDDALRALAGRWLPYSDPLGGDWLGGALRGMGTGIDFAGFDEWNGAGWTRTLPWPADAAAMPPSTIEEDCDALAPGEARECELRNAQNAAEQAAAAADAAAGFDAAAVDVETSQPVRSLSREDVLALGPVGDILAAPSPVAPPPPPGALADAYANDGEATSLDRIEVTGSRIKRTDLESSPGGAPDPLLRLDREQGSPALRDLARIRTEFADTALWQSGIRLAPGESRRIELKLPDNLTRWRAVAWSNDAGDDFAMAEAALETGLPVEVRLQTPVRIYPGDRARLAANVRQTGDMPVDARTELHIAGMATPIEKSQTLPLGAGGQGSVATEIAPDEAGALLVTASAETSAGRDAVAAPIEVASPLIDARKVQAGWLGDSPLLLDLPVLPDGASLPRLRLSLLRGDAGLIERWSHDLHDYPHRCWEQILSRAVAAALAIERDDANWPDAQAVVQEALDNAAVFQDGNGGFRYFAEASEAYGSRSSSPAYVPLTAYTVRAFSLLRGLGHPVNADIDSQARDYLAQAMSETRVRAVANDDALASAAFAASARDDVPQAQLDALWNGWLRLALPARIAAARAFARHQHAASAAAVASLLTNAPERGSVRVLRLPQRYDLWMSSDLREQCALIELLHDYPQLGPRNARRALIAGLTDLYAGGNGAVDTQTGATCLMALRDLGNAANTDRASAKFSVGSSSVDLHLARGEARSDGAIDTVAAKQLRVEPQLQGEHPASYVAELHYQEDARQARASAVGLSIERRHEVLRQGKWVAIEAQSLHEGDWIRITLTIISSAPRYFVAVTDAVPGGLRPTDLELGGVGGLDLQKISDLGSGAFATRRLDARSPRFYAEYLPAGRNELHYFARAGNGGDYLAAPAVVELMYGNATSARTAAARLKVSASDR